MLDVCFGAVIAAAALPKGVAPPLTLRRRAAHSRCCCPYPLVSSQAFEVPKHGSKVHTVCCRVRRKRQRLTSNGSIESDAAIGSSTSQVYLAASLPIEC